jgi:alkylated DNA repair dioxygenase AlkB
MELFNTADQLKDNLLPYDGTVKYYGPIMSVPEADQFYELLLRNIDWKNDEAVIFGKHILTKRKVAWYGDAAFEYTYSKTTKSALPWTAELLLLKNTVEQHSGEQYNSCLLNLYHNGQEGMAWHSDAEKNLIKDGAIGSLSFGAERKFAFKHKASKEVVKMTLQHGSLLVMKGITQTHWLHRLLTTTSVNTPRINLTFRTIRL